MQASHQTDSDSLQADHHGLSDHCHQTGGSPFRPASPAALGPAAGHTLCARNQIGLRGPTASWNVSRHCHDFHTYATARACSYCCSVRQHGSPPPAGYAPAVNMHCSHACIWTHAATATAYRSCAHSSQCTSHNSGCIAVTLPASSAIKAAAGCVPCGWLVTYRDPAGCQGEECADNRSADLVASR